MKQLGRLGRVMGRSRSRGRSTEPRRTERGRSRERRPASAFARPRSRSSFEDQQRTGRALSVDAGRLRYECSQRRAAHILDKHGDEAAATDCVSASGRLPSYFRSHGVLDRTVHRTLARPDASRDADDGKKFLFKTFSHPRGLGHSGVGNGIDNVVCDTVAVVVDPDSGDVVTTYPIPRAMIQLKGTGPIQQIRPETDPPSLLSDSTSAQLSDP